MCGGGVTERKDTEIKETIWGKQTYSSKSDSAERKCSQKWPGHGTLSTFQEVGRGKWKLSRKPRKTKSLRCLPCHGKVESGCFPPGWELPNLAAEIPEEALPFHPLSKPRNLIHQGCCAALNQVLVTLSCLHSSTKETPFPPDLLKTSKNPRINPVPRELLDFEILLNRLTYGGTQ